MKEIILQISKEKYSDSKFQQPKETLNPLSSACFRVILFLRILLVIKGKGDFDAKFRTCFLVFYFICGIIIM